MIDEPSEETKKSQKTVEKMALKIHTSLQKIGKDFNKILGGLKDEVPD